MTAKPKKKPRKRRDFVTELVESIDAAFDLSGLRRAVDVVSRDEAATTTRVCETAERLSSEVSAREKADGKLAERILELDQRLDYANRRIAQLEKHRGSLQAAEVLEKLKPELLDLRLRVQMLEALATPKPPHEPEVAVHPGGVIVWSGPPARPGIYRLEPKR